MNNYISKWCCLIIFNPDQLYFDPFFSLGCTLHLYQNANKQLQGEKHTTGYEKYWLSAGETGTQIQNAFANAFAKGLRKVVLVKSDFDKIQPNQIIEAFNCLKMIECCIGPKDNGDYYLIGMNYFEPVLFENKHWDAPTLTKDTIKDVGNLKLALYKLSTLKSEEHVTAVNT